MADSGSHTSFLAPDFSSPASSFLYTHEKAPVEKVLEKISCRMITISRQGGASLTTKTVSGKSRRDT